uniref:Magnesium transporter n=1 Tax=Hemiselmis andersenii TaxID=464988 RepID=A0A6U5A8C8_HEMAN|mmetsp:Transcript_46513/g.113081  ORF Transcript_46513/g.113081 Transcript_46513/m.113081 type:complete len:316 (+) Transcript_46513:143-1090(+)
MQSVFLGVFVSLLGNSLIGSSFSVMKVAHDSNKDGKSYLRIPTWWAGTLLMILGEAGNLVAYTLAKPSLISPLGAISVVVNVPVGWMVLGEKPSMRNMLGCMMSIVGGYGIVWVVASGSVDRPTMTAAEFEALLFQPAFMVFLAISFGESIDLIWSGRRTVMTYVMVCSLLGGVSVLSIKAVSSFVLLTLQGDNQFLTLVPFTTLPILAFTLMLQIKYLNMALAEFGTPEVVPIYYVTFTSCAVIGSSILYGDLSETSHQNVAVFVFSFLLTAAGVWLVSRGSVRKEETRARSASLGQSPYPNSEELEDDTQSLL